MSFTLTKKPYISKIDERGSLQAWFVDGSYIRGHLDNEFTNFGQHYRHPYIPQNELWIDWDPKGDETNFYIDHLLVEHRLMAQGIPYAKALEEADREERKQRRRAGDLNRLTHNGATLPDIKSVHQHLWKRLENGTSVWVVDGRLVRSVFDIDFTAGGHDHVYEFVPADEVWIDDKIDENERAYILLHELHERNRMAKGWTYSKSHLESSRLEYRCRHHPDELHPALIKEGWA
jgi:hypothetical protein